MVARVARPARKKTKKIINYNRNNLDNFLPTTATAVYGIQPQCPKVDATKVAKNSCPSCLCCSYNKQATKGRAVVLKKVAVVVYSTVSTIRMP